MTSLRRIAMAASADDFDGAAAEYRTYYGLTFGRAWPLPAGHWRKGLIADELDLDWPSP